MRRFELHREQDATGVSGTGVVAQGIEFDDGVCALRWLTAISSTAIYASSDDIRDIHGHGGLTQLVFLDRPDIDLQFQVGPDDPDSEKLRALLTRREEVEESILTRRQEVLARMKKI